MLYLAFFISIFRFEPNEPNEPNEPADKPNELAEEVDNNNNLILQRQFVSFSNNNLFL